MTVIVSSAEDVLLDWAVMEAMFQDDECFLVVLSGWQISLIKSLLRYSHWSKRWINVTDWDTVEASVEELEYCLMAGCSVSELITVLEEIRDKIPSPGQTLTLQNIYDNIVTTSPDDDDLYHAYPLLEKIIDFLPDEFVESYRIDDPAGFAVSLFSEAENLVLQKWSTLFEALQGIGDLIEGIADSGEAVADVAAITIGEIPELISAGALSVSAIVDLLNLFIAISHGGTKSEDPDNDEDLRAMLRVYNNIFVEQQAMSVTQNNVQTVNCGGGCGGLGGGVCFVADESGAGSSIDQPEYSLPTGNPPSDWENWEGEDGYYAYKCKAANAMTLGIAERLYQLGDIGNGSYAGSTHAITARNIEEFLRAFDETAIISGTFTLLPIFTTDVDHPLLVMVRSWEAQKIADYFYPTPDVDPFQIFYDLRLNWLADREDRVCDLYNAGSTSEASTAILDAVDTYFSGYSSYTAGEKAWARAIIEGMLLNSWLNLLFSKDDTIDQYEDETAVDCSVCENCFDLATVDFEQFIQYGTLAYDNWNGTTRTIRIDSQYAPQYQHHIAQVDLFPVTGGYSCCLYCADCNWYGTPPSDTYGYIFRQCGETAATGDVGVPDDLDETWSTLWHINSSLPDSSFTLEFQFQAEEP